MKISDYQLLGQKNLLNVSMIVRDCTVLGPGRRYVIWLQGCLFNCHNCSSPEFKPLREAKLMTVESVLNDILNRDYLDGITISGGEPFLQSEALFKLVKSIRIRSKLNIILYTGYNLKDLKWHSAQMILENIDVLIAGKYVDHLNNNRGLRGSTNQQIYFLTDELKRFEEDFYNRNRNYSIYFKDEQIIIVGLMPYNVKNEDLLNFKGGNDDEYQNFNSGGN